MRLRCRYCQRLSKSDFWGGAQPLLQCSCNPNARICCKLNLDASLLPIAWTPSALRSCVGTCCCVLSVLKWVSCCTRRQRGAAGAFEDAEGPSLCERRLPQHSTADYSIACGSSLSFQWRNKQWLSEQVPLIVYLEDAAGGHGYRPIAKYGEDFRNRRPARLALRSLRSSFSKDLPLCW